MKNKLKQTDLTYLLILYYIWKMVAYYSELFQIDAGDDAQHVTAQLIEKGGYTTVRFTFLRTFHAIPEYKAMGMKSIYNDFLRYALLPENRILKPYAAGKNEYEIIEPLYVTSVQEGMGYMHIEVIYIDNNLAYEAVRSDERKSLEV